MENTARDALKQPFGGLEDDGAHSWFGEQKWDNSCGISCLVCGMKHNGGCTKAFSTRQKLATFIFGEFGTRWKSHVKSLTYDVDDMHHHPKDQDQCLLWTCTIPGGISHQKGALCNL